MIAKLKIFMAAALLAGGCGADTELAQPVGGASGQELADEQVLRWGNGAEPQTLDPHRVVGVPGANIVRDLFEGLMSEAPDGKVIAGVARSWIISDDGKSYVFKLRRDARWSNGEPLGADDFVYSVRRSLDPATQSRYTFILNPILNAKAVTAGDLPTTELGVRALDSQTLEIRLENPTPYFLELLTHSASYPVHRPSVSAHGNQYARVGNLVSNGAYQLAERVVGSHIKLIRNPEYWNDENTTIDEVFFYPMKDPSAELNRYRAGEIDITNSVPFPMIARLKDNLPDELMDGPLFATYYYSLNTTTTFKDNTPLRQALSLAIDRDTIVGLTAAGRAPAYSWVPPVQNYPGSLMEEATWTQAQRNDKARRLYAQAGHSKANPLRLQIIYNSSEDHERVALAIASMWTSLLGVEVEVVNMEWNAYLTTC